MEFEATAEKQEKVAQCYELKTVEIFGLNSVQSLGGVIRKIRSGYCTVDYTTANQSQISIYPHGINELEMFQQLQPTWPFKCQNAEVATEFQGLRAGDL